MRKVPTLALVAVCCNSAVYANFVEDSQTTLNARNFFIDRNNSTQPDVGSWSQALGLKFSSGYTDTPVQVGLDVTSSYALRLSEHNAERSDSIFAYDQVKGKQERSYHKFGATLKLKYKESELLIGELSPRSPAAFIDDSRQLVTTYAGAALETKAIKDLKISAGRITHINARNDDEFEKLSLFAPGKTRIESDGLSYVGFDYNFTPKITGAYWFSQLEDIYNQHYVNAAYSTQLGDTKLKFDARYFHNSEAGDKFYGNIDSKTVGLIANVIHGPHTFAAGVQKNSGDTNFPTFDGFAPQPYLHTWSTLAFIKPEELTYHALYSYDFKEMGVPGLKTTLRYLHGTNIERQGLPDNKEREANFILGYTVPEGALKGLGVEWRYIDTATKYGNGVSNGNDFVENRIITTYSMKF